MNPTDITTDNAPECPFGEDCLETCDNCVGMNDTPIEAIARGLIVSFG